MSQSRWQRLWGAVAKWWRNEPEFEPEKISSEFLHGARRYLVEYDDLYGQRTQTCPGHRMQAVNIIAAEGHKRSPGIPSEVRTLAIVVERLLGHLEEEKRVREYNKLGVKKRGKV